MIWAPEENPPDNFATTFPTPTVVTILRDFGISKNGRAFLVTDHPMSKMVRVGIEDQNSLAPDWFPNNLIRRDDPTSLEIYRAIVQTGYASSPPVLSSYFPNGTRVQNITLKKSEAKKVAVDAMESTLLKIGLSDRIATKAAQATDELLLNAIFDAAADRNGTKKRQHLDRKARFDFAPHENVTLEFAFSDGYIGISVIDNYGSLQKEIVYRNFAQNYRTADYKLRKFGPGSGLGLYGIIEMGLSLLLVTKRNVSTNVMIFFPLCKTHKDFKNRFQFTACFSD